MENMVGHIKDVNQSKNNHNSSDFRDMLPRGIITLRPTRYRASCSGFTSLPSTSASPTPTEWGIEPFHSSHHIVYCRWITCCLLKWQPDSRSRITSRRSSNGSIRCWPVEWRRTEWLSWWEGKLLIRRLAPTILNCMVTIKLVSSLREGIGTYSGSIIVGCRFARVVSSFAHLL